MIWKIGGLSASRNIFERLCSFKICQWPIFYFGSVSMKDSTLVSSVCSNWNHIQFVYPMVKRLAVFYLLSNCAGTKELQETPDSLVDVYRYCVFVYTCIIYLCKCVHQTSVMLLPNLPRSSLPGVSSQNTDSSRRRESTCAYYDGSIWWLIMIPVVHARLFMVSFIIEFVCFYCVALLFCVR